MRVRKQHPRSRKSGGHQRGPGGVEVLYGVHSVEEALKAKKRIFNKFFVLEKPPAAWKRISPLIPKGVPVERLSQMALNRQCGNTDHQGIAALTSVLRPAHGLPKSKDFPFLVLLDGIQDVRNLGAIARTTFCVGGNALVIPKKGSAPVNSVVSKASAGLIERLPFFIFNSIGEAMEQLQRQGYKMVAATFGGAPLSDFSFERALCVIIGSEGKGISTAVSANRMVKKVTIPQVSDDISYNSSVAAGIVLYTAGMAIGTIG